jgi:hypothetical protein
MYETEMVIKNFVVCMDNESFFLRQQYGKMGLVLLMAMMG